MAAVGAAAVATSDAVQACGGAVGAVNCEVVWGQNS